MRRRALAVLVTALAIPVAIAAGCTTPPDNGYNLAGRSQMLPGLATDSTTLAPDGTEAAVILPGLCAPAGVKCHKDTDCCKGECIGGVVGGNAGSCGETSSGGMNVCAPDGVVCEVHTDCCTPYCSMDGVCGALPGSVCAPDGVTCTQDTDCCNGCTVPPTEPCVQCKQGACNGPLPSAKGAPLCVPLFVNCTPGSGADCCLGDCVEDETFSIPVCVLESP